MTPTLTTTADPATETGISSGLPRGLVLAALTLGLAACGGHGPPATTGQPHTGRAAPPSGRSVRTGAFSWLRPAPPPAGWRIMHIPSGASAPYPPAWRPIRSDPGTASVARFGPGHRFIGYVNLTPQQGPETVANWARFRPRHNADEGDRHIRTLAVGRSLRFRTGRGACIRDSYATSSGHRYVELACIVAGRRATTVVVGAAPPDSWSRVSSVIERVISALTT